MFEDDKSSFVGLIHPNRYLLIFLKRKASLFLNVFLFQICNYHLKINFYLKI